MIPAERFRRAPEQIAQHRLRLGVAVHLLTTAAWTGIVLAILALGFAAWSARGGHAVFAWIAVLGAAAPVGRERTIPRRSPAWRFRTRRLLYAGQPKPHRALKLWAVSRRLRA